MTSSLEVSSSNSYLIFHLSNIKQFGNLNHYNTPTLIEHINLHITGFLFNIKSAKFSEKFDQNCPSGLLKTFLEHTGKLARSALIIIIIIIISNNGLVILDKTHKFSMHFKIQNLNFVGAVQLLRKLFFCQFCPLPLSQSVTPAPTPPPRNVTVGPAENRKSVCSQISACKRVYVIITGTRIIY